MIQFTKPFRRINYLMLLVIGSGLMVASCKKDPKLEPYDVQVEVRDSAYLKIKDIYLWEDLLPSIQEFRPRDAKDIYEVMTRVRSYQPLDRFSFVETKEETERAMQGLSSDFGFLVKFFTSLTDLRVNYVYSSSPAGLQGVKRGWRILRLNDRELNGNNKADIDYINEIFLGSATSANFTFEKPDGSVLTTTINKAVFPLNTVLFRNVYNVGSRKVGYFVYNEFSGPSSVQELIATMNYFVSNGINDMIVDLRYNRGGFVSTQDTLANMLAPQNAGRGQKVMYTYEFNKRYSHFNENTLFYKTGSINLNRIVFIVTPASASASELLINNLKPVLDVKLVGEENTFGKPVGFFPIPVFEYSIYPVSFRTVNSAGSADYYEGFPVDKNTVDDLSHDFGDLNEASLKEALNYLNTGAFTTKTQKRILSTSEVTEFDLAEANADLDKPIPKVEIEDRLPKMPEAIRELQRK
jgi:carboxyl-terminal processing protease